MSALVQYASAGCVVEYLEGNAVQIALVTEAAGGRLRLLLPNRRETRLSESRLLPWIGPSLGAGLGREDGVKALEAHMRKREDAAREVPVDDIWETAQGEMSEAPAQWFAELAGLPADADGVAATGRALLACRSRFRFQPPLFQIFSAEMVEKRLAEQKEREDRERIVAGGAAFLRALWDLACRREILPPDSPLLPDPETAEHLARMLSARMADPESRQDEALWKLLSHGLPDVPHLPFQLLQAWGRIPPHHNFWLDRAGYVPGDGWWAEFADEVEALLRDGEAADIPDEDLPFLSIDGATTRDVDDAFHLAPLEDGGWRLTLALACPALAWPFGGALDRAVSRRATSIYLPEGDCHMLPETLGADRLALKAGERRPALRVVTDIGPDGLVRSCDISPARVRVAANLVYDDCQDALDAFDAGGAPDADNPAAPHLEQLRMGRDMARARQAKRIADGAVIMDRPEFVVSLVGEGADVRVYVTPERPCPDTHPLVAEMMILAAAAAADWAAERDLPMLHRTQDVALPREYAGVWSEPQDMARIMHALASSTLEVQARPHAALGLSRYTPVTSPLRRYSDLVNEAQILHFLKEGAPRWDAEALRGMALNINLAADAAGQVQRFRPRYWKLLFFRQQGDGVWWDAVVTEENDLFVNVSLTDGGIFIRGKRKLFGERVQPGMPVRVRLGRVNPLYNEIFIAEVMPLE